MRDFTLHTYKKLLNSLLKNGYEFQTVEEFISSPKEKCAVLRHDSDIWPKNDLKMAHLENELGIKSTYYFRVPETSDEFVINEIFKLNHEIGYHYEDLVRTNGNFSEAYNNFEKNLAFLRNFYPVTTCSRHGRPLSNIDSLHLWKNFDYKSKFNLKGEVYLDIDYSDILYLTDNGSRWDAHESNVRDFVPYSRHTLSVSTTFDLIQAINQNRVPNKIILNCHPARWNNNLIIWSYRFVLQHIKNVAKRGLKKIRS
ncbi:MAG: hypothetical protein ACKO7D_02870 [Bacteroidota bacterium]